MTGFLIYPTTPRPQWAEVGTRCHCSGDGDELFQIEACDDDGSKALLSRVRDDCIHGWESYRKITLPARIKATCYE